ncbi:MAG: VPLPA-CTERM sorting domain-containing protein [Rhodocyclaceae bacterium]|nr:VPLPA-CTERM sorting domain-containing protein [Rhodocyclaceae bacterium]
MRSVQIGMGVVALLTSGVLNAAVYSVTEFNLWKGGTFADWATSLTDPSLGLNDQFDNGDPLVGPFYTGLTTAANYLPRNFQAGLGLTESGGVLQMDTDFALPSTGAGGASGPAAGLRLLSNVDSSQTNASGGILGLHKSASFAVAAAFELQIPPLTGQYGIRLFDSFSDGTEDNQNDYLDFRVVSTNQGPVVWLRHQDFEQGIAPVLAAHSLAAPAGATQIYLTLAHQQANSGLIDAYYGYRDASGALIGAPVYLASKSIFHGEDFTRVELRAIAPVPEPLSGVMMLAGLGVLAAMGRRARA